MEEDAKKLLRRNLELARENNKLLKKIRRNGLVANIMRLVWWAVLIGVPVYLYYYVLQPYMAELGTAYRGASDGVQAAQEALLGIPFIGDMISSFLGGEFP